MATPQTISTVNGIDLDVLHETVSAIENDPALAKCKFRASNKWINGNHNRTRITGFYGAKQEMTHQQSFELHADEPPVLAGDDQAPNPVEHLLNALAGCMTTGMVAHAAVRGITSRSWNPNWKATWTCAVSSFCRMKFRGAIRTSASSSESRPTLTTWNASEG